MFLKDNKNPKGVGGGDQLRMSTQKNNFNKEKSLQ